MSQRTLNGVIWLTEVSPFARAIVKRHERSSGPVHQHRDHTLVRRAKALNIGQLIGASDKTYCDLPGAVITRHGILRSIEVRHLSYFIEDLCECRQRAANEGSSEDGLRYGFHITIDGSWAAPGQEVS